MTDTSTPLSPKIDRIELVNWSGTRVINIIPQVVNLSIYENIDEPFMRAEIYLNDMISLVNNFPIIGEEFVVVIFENDEVSMPFFVEYIENIKLEKKGTTSNYIMSLVNPLSIADSMTNVMKAYRGPVSSMVRGIYNDYIVDGVRQLTENSAGFAYVVSRHLTTHNFLTVPVVEESLGDDNGVVCIPNMKPVHAIKWLASKAVPKNYSESYDYKFFQSSKGSVFATTHYLVNKSKNNIKTDRKYIYIGENALVNKTNYEHKNVIKNLYVHNRHKTISKITDGYFQNMFFEINLARLQYKGRNSDIADYKAATSSIKLSKNDKSKDGTLNTQSFSSAVKSLSNINGTIESNNRVAYFFNNREENEYQTPLMNFEEVWGNKVRAATGFSQISVEITIEGEENIAAGDVVSIIIPSFHGFTEHKDDEQISGVYLVVGVKQFFFNNIHTTVLALQKDVFQKNADDYEYRYGDGLISSDQNFTADVSNPDYASKVLAAIKKAKEKADEALKLTSNSETNTDNPLEVINAKDNSST